MVEDSPYLQEEALPLQDLALSLLTLDPRVRISAVDCLTRFAVAYLRLLAEGACSRYVHAGGRCLLAEGACSRGGSLLAEEHLALHAATATRVQHFVRH